MVLREIIVKQCTDRVLYALVIGNTNSASRWICQQLSIVSYFRE
jgi:hypothetical protein